MSVSLEKSDKYQQITNKIIQGLEEVQPGQWKCPWHKIGAVGLPLNGVTKRSIEGLTGYCYQLPVKKQVAELSQVISNGRPKEDKSRKAQLVFP